LRRIFALLCLCVLPVLGLAHPKQNPQPVGRAVAFHGSAPGSILGLEYGSAQLIRPTAEGKPVVEWVEQLKSAEARKRDEAISELGNMGPRAKAAVIALIEALRDMPKNRDAAARALGCIGSEAKAAVTPLTEILKDEVFFRRYWASWALGEILGETGPEDAKAAVPALLEALKSEDDGFVRRGIASALRRVGSEAAPVVAETLKEKNDSARLAEGKPLSEWVELLKSADRSQRQAAAGTIRKIGPLAKAAVLPLIEALKDPQGRFSVAIALGSIGPEAQAAVKPLAEHLKDDYYPVRYYAAFALGEIGPQAQVRALMEALKREDVEFVRRGIASAMGRVGPQAVPALVDALEDRNDSMRHSAALALSQIGPSAKAAVPALTKALNDPVDFVQAAAGMALKRIDAVAAVKSPAK
jgi:HEAT repeat protein